MSSRWSKANQSKHKLNRRFGRSLALGVVALVSLSVASLTQAGWWDWFQPQPSATDPKSVIFVGNNWEGMIDVVDANTYEKIGRINGIPDKSLRMVEILFNPVHAPVFFFIRNTVGEGNDQYVDDMYSSNDGKLLIVSRPSFADVVAIDIATNEIVWRYRVKGFRSDHMAISPDGKTVAVSASTGNVVHVLDVQTGAEVGRFATGDSPHENVYSKDGKRIFHASIGRVYTSLDGPEFDALKGKRVFQVVNSDTMEIMKRIDIKEKLEAAGYHDISPAVRPMAHTADERYFYFQLSFLHGFIEYDMQTDTITRMANLPKITTVPRTKYVNDSAHHGIAINGSDDTFCVAGTMDDYVALVDRSDFSHTLLKDLGKKPYWVTTNKTGDKCYISWSETDQMSVISYADKQEIARVDVGRHPQRIREGFVPATWGN